MTSTTYMKKAQQRKKAKHLSRWKRSRTLCKIIPIQSRRKIRNMSRREAIARKRSQTRLLGTYWRWKASYGLNKNQDKLRKKLLKQFKKRATLFLQRKRKKIDLSKCKDKRVNNSDKDFNKARDNSQGSSNANMLTPYTDVTTYLLQLGENIEIDFGGYQLENRHGCHDQKSN